MKSSSTAMIPSVRRHPQTLQEESARDVAKRVAEYATEKLGCALTYEDVRFLDVGEAGESVYVVLGFAADGEAS